MSETPYQQYTRLMDEISNEKRALARRAFDAARDLIAAQHACTHAQVISIGGAHGYNECDNCGLKDL